MFNLNLRLLFGGWTKKEKLQNPPKLLMHHGDWYYLGKNPTRQKGTCSFFLKTNPNVLETNPGHSQPPKNFQKKAPHFAGDSSSNFPPFFRPSKHIEVFLHFARSTFFDLIFSHRCSHFSRTGFEKAFFGSAKIESVFVVYKLVGEGILLMIFRKRARRGCQTKTECRIDL